MTDELNLKVWETKFTFTILLAIVTVYCLYHFQYWKNVPCENDFTNILFRNFIHTNTFHFISNLAGLIILYKVESSTGFNHFACIFTSILILNSFVEWVLYKNFDLSCSIGLSGIIFGFAVFELLTLSDCTLSAITGLVAMITLPSIKSTDISIVGHLVGVLSGIVVALMYKCVK